MAVRFLDHTPLTLVKTLMDRTKGIIDNRHQLIHYAIEGLRQPMMVPPISMENRFITAGRPFFNVYPRVLEALSRTPLNVIPGSITKSVIHELPAISVRLPLGHSITKTVGTYFVMSIFDGKSFETLNTAGLTRLFNSNRPFMCVYSEAETTAEGMAGQLSTCPLNITFDDVDGSFEMVKSEEGKHAIQALSSNHEARMKMACRIALGVMMLAADPDFIKPVLLKADEGKTTPLEERIARAKKRGVYGFTIGEDIETCPHFRRPHFAIRWTGKGSTIPKLVPIKGAVINKRLMTTVPTGYEST